MEATLATLMIHGDDALRQGTSVASEMSVSTTFRQARPAESENGHSGPDPSKHVYSRYSQPTLARAEKLLSQAMGGPALLYSSGLGVD